MIKAQQGSFVCKNCGEKIVRKLSAIKNPSLVFCNNACRAQFAEKQSLVRQCGGKQLFERDCIFCNKIIKSCFCLVVKRLNVAGRVTLQELEQEAKVAIWKYCGTANNGAGDKGSFYYSVIKRAMYNYVKSVLFRDAASGLFGLDEQQDLIYYTTPEHLFQMKETANYLINRPQRAGSNAYALLLKYSFENITIDDISLETGMTPREITIKMANARKQLTKELSERGYK